jgi:hypothetical protein
MFEYTGPCEVDQYDEEGWSDALHVAEIHDWIVDAFATEGSK